MQNEIHFNLGFSFPTIDEFSGANEKSKENPLGLQIFKLHRKLHQSESDFNKDELKEDFYGKFLMDWF